jgi:hypothetical protein
VLVVFRRQVFGAKVWGAKRGSVMKKRKGSVATEIQRLAQANGVTAERDGLSWMAVTITRLAGDSVSLDSVEQMLINLKRKGALSKPQAFDLQRRYVIEKREAKGMLGG